MGNKIELQNLDTQYYLLARDLSTKIHKVDQCVLSEHLLMRDRFGELVTATVVPTVAFASYDQPEISSVTGCKGNYQGMPMFCHRHDPARLLHRGHSHDATVATVNGTRWPVCVAARSDPTLATFQWRALDGYSTVATGSRPLLP